MSERATVPEFASDSPEQKLQDYNRSVIEMIRGRDNYQSTYTRISYGFMNIWESLRRGALAGAGNELDLSGLLARDETVAALLPDAYSERGLSRDDWLVAVSLAPLRLATREQLIDVVTPAFVYMATEMAMRGFGEHAACSHDDQASDVTDKRVSCDTLLVCPAQACNELLMTLLQDAIIKFFASPDIHLSSSASIKLMNMQKAIEASVRKHNLMTVEEFHHKEDELRESTALFYGSLNALLHD